MRLNLFVSRISITFLYPSSIDIVSSILFEIYLIVSVILFNCLYHQQKRISSKSISEFFADPLFFLLAVVGLSTWSAPRYRICHSPLSHRVLLLTSSFTFSTDIPIVSLLVFLLINFSLSPFDLVIQQCQSKTQYSDYRKPQDYHTSRLLIYL